MTQRSASRRKGLLGMVAAIALGLVGSFVPSASSQISYCEIGDQRPECQPTAGESVSACYRNEGEKMVRVVDSKVDCYAHETFVQLSPGERGPEGPQGPAGESGDGLPSKRWYADRDKDGYGDWYDRIDSAVKPVRFVDNNDDCNDDEADVNPGTGTNSGRGQDFDCDGIADDRAIRWYRDRDGDGWGLHTEWVTNQDAKPSGYVIYPHDCDDNNRTIFPGSHANDDGNPGCLRVRRGQTVSFDQDQDGHHHLWYNGDDCNDSAREMYPGQTETVYDGLDNDCNADTLDVEPYVANVGRHDPEWWGVIAPPRR